MAKGLCVASGIWALFACATPPATAPVPVATPAPKPVNAACVTRARPLASWDQTAPRSYSEAETAYRRGLNAVDQGDYGRALAAFSSAVRADQSFGLAHLAKADAHLYTDNDTALMRTHVATAVVLMPQNPRAHFRFAQISAELGDHAAAEQHYACALEQKPSMMEAHHRLARLLLDQGRLAEAQSHLDTALSARPSDYRLYTLMSRVLEAKGRIGAAGESLWQAAELVGRSAPLYRRAAHLFTRAGLEGAAVQARAKADILDPPPQTRELRPLPEARPRRKRAKARRGKRRR